jgi:hypothetical protein
MPMCTFGLIYFASISFPADLSLSLSHGDTMSPRLLLSRATELSPMTAHMPVPRKEAKSVSLGRRNYFRISANTLARKSRLKGQAIFTHDRAT